MASRYRITTGSSVRSRRCQRSYKACTWPTSREPARFDSGAPRRKRPRGPLIRRPFAPLKEQPSLAASIAAARRSSQGIRWLRQSTVPLPWARRARGRVNVVGPSPVVSVRVQAPARAGGVMSQGGYAYLISTERGPPPCGQRTESEKLKPIERRFSRRPNRSPGSGSSKLGMERATGFEPAATSLGS